MFLEIRKITMHIDSLHTLVGVMNVDAPPHKIFQIFGYKTFYSEFESILSHQVQCHQNIYGVHHNTMLHFSVMCLVNMNTLVCTFTNKLCKNISDKGSAPCTLTTLCIIHTLTKFPTIYIFFFNASLNRRINAFIFTNVPLRRVTRYATCLVNL